MDPRSENQLIPLDGPGKEMISAQDLIVMRYVPAQEAAPPPEAGFEISKRSLFYMLFRHKFKIAACFLFVTFAAFVYVATQPNLYASEALIRIRGMRNNMLIDPASDEGSLLKSQRVDPTALSAETDLIQGDGLLLRVIDKLTPEKIFGITGPIEPVAHPVRDFFFRLLNFETKPLNLRDAALIYIKDHMEIFASPASRELLHVTYKSGDPARSQMVLNAILDEFLAFNLAASQARFSPEFFKQRTQETARQLERAKDQLEEKRRELSIVVPATEKDLLVQRQSSIEASLLEASSQAVAAAETLKVLEGFARRYESKTGQKLPRMANPVAQDMQRKLIDLQTEEAKLAAKFNDSHPSLVELRSQITSLKSALKAVEANYEVDPIAMTMGMNDPQFSLSMRIETAHADQAATAARIKQLQAQKVAVDGKLKNLLEHERSLTDLEQQIERLSLEHNRYLASQQSSEIARTLDQDQVSNVSVDQPATLPFMSAKSQRKMLALLGLGSFMGLAMGLGWAFLLEYTNSTIRSRAEAEAQLGVPVLISIPAVRRHLALLEGSRDV